MRSSASAGTRPFFPYEDYFHGISSSLSNVQVTDFAEMMAIDGKRNIQREQSRPPKKGPDHDLPILESFPPKNTQADARSQHCQ